MPSSSAICHALLKSRAAPSMSPSARLASARTSQVRAKIESSSSMEGIGRLGTASAAPPRPHFVCGEDIAEVFQLIDSQAVFGGRHYHVAPLFGLSLGCSVPFNNCTVVERQRGEDPGSFPTRTGHRKMARKSLPRERRRSESNR